MNDLEWNCNKKLSCVSGDALSAIASFKWERVNGEMLNGLVFV
jgi:hypothetical protein